MALPSPWVRSMIGKEKDGSVFAVNPQSVVIDGGNASGQSGRKGI